jgi:glycine/D-amino acid oxidase-like deaminating enzyme
MSNNKSLSITVLGAGIVGVNVALALQRDGHRVTLIDRDEAGHGCSYGNAGMIQAGAVMPIATPGVLGRVPSMLLDKNSPLVIRWQHLPSLAPYLTNFIAAARPAKVAETGNVLARLLSEAVTSYTPLLAASGADSLVREHRELLVFRSQAAFDARQSAFAYQKERGIDIEQLDAAQVHELESALSADFIRGALLPSYFRVTNPLQFTQTLLGAFIRQGGVFRREWVQNIRPAEDGGVVLETAAGNIEAPHFVLATGAHSGQWAANLGSKLPVNTERGYHVVLPQAGGALSRPVTLAEHRVGVVPMAEGLRIVGTAELASVDTHPYYERAFRLIGLTKQALPNLDARGARPWMGRRPSTPDSLPVVGKSPLHHGVYFAFGHGHLGLTLGAVTGRIIADLIGQRPTHTDIHALRADRF